VNSNFPHVLLPDTLFSAQKIHLNNDLDLRHQVL
jgi:hypothetical protein